MTSPPGARARPGFVGHADDLDRVARAWADAPSLVLVEGERGVGRSRFAAEAARTWPAGTGPDDGVLWVDCPPRVELSPLGPVIAALRGLRARVAAVDLDPVAGALRAVLPEWSDLLPASPEPLDDAAAARYRLVRAMVDVVGRCGVGLIVVDDAHHADPATLDLVAAAAAEPDLRGAGIVLTSCPADDGAGAGALRRLTTHRDPARRQVRVLLRPLTRDESAAMIASVLDDRLVSDQLVDRIHTDTVGLPAAIEEIVTEMDRRGDIIARGTTWTTGWRTPLPVPAVTRDVVLDRLGRLSDAGRRAAEAVVALAGPTDVALVARLADIDVTVLQDGLAAAAAAGLARYEPGPSAGTGTGPGAADRVAARSPLVARVIEESLPRHVRRRRHTRAVEVLGAVDGVDIADLARHARAAGDAARWRSYAEAAAQARLAAGDDHGAVTLLHDLVSDGDHAPADRTRLAHVLGSATVGGAAALGDLGVSVAAVLGEVIERTQAGPPDGEDAAELRALRGRLLTQLGEFEAASAEVEEALPGLRSRPEIAVAAMTSLAFPRGQDWPARRHVRWLERSRGLVEDLEPHDRVRVSVDRVTALLMLGEESGWQEVAELDAEASTSATSGRELARFQMNVGHLAILWGRDDESWRRLDDAIERMQATDYARLRNSAELTRAHLDYRAGRWDGLGERVIAMADAEDTLPEARLEAYVVLGLLALAAGDRAVAEAYLREPLVLATARRLDDVRPSPAAGLGRLYLRAGDVDRALEVTGPAVDLVAGKDVWIWGSDVVPVHVRALTAAGDLAAAETLVSRFAAGVATLAAPAAQAAVETCRGTVAETVDPPAAAARHASAARLWGAVRRPFDRLLAEVARAEAVRAAGDRQTAVDALAGAHRELRELGATWDADRVAQLLRNEGVDVPKVWRGGRRGYGDQLSPREMEVTRLVARGLTNREVAAELSLSPRTVDRHLGRAMRKLDVTSRTALAVAAHDAGLLAAQAPTADDAPTKNG